MSAAATAPVAPGIAIYCVDPSVSAVDLRAYVTAQTGQLAELADEWSALPISCELFADKSQIPRGTPTILIAPRCDDPEALAYHTEGIHGEITGLVGVDTCREAGVSWQSAASHEACETARDAFVNAWVQGPSGDLVALEICDPVQDKVYTVKVAVDGAVCEVELSDYVLPAYFDPRARGVLFDRMGALSAPFSKTSGGYYVAMRAGTTHQVGLRAAHKPSTSLSRGSRRRHAKSTELDGATLDAVRLAAHELGGAAAQVVYGACKLAADRAAAS